MSTLINLIETLRKNISDEARNENLSEQTQVHLATAVALNLAVPAQAETTGTAYYNQNYAAKVRSMISEINELYLLDVSCVLKLIERNYAARFNFVHAPTSAIDVVNAISAFIHGQCTEGQPTIDLTVSELTRIGNGVAGFLREEQEHNDE